MVSGKKLRANCENAKLGGVKTPQGKAISKNNSLKHGILAQGSAADDSISLESVYNLLHKEFNPEKPSREILVQQLALTTVRLSRCLKLESQIFENQFNALWSLDEALERLCLLGERYESRLVGRMLRLIEALKEK